MFNINKKLEVPCGGKKRLFIYVQAYNSLKCQINVYYYTGLPYSSAVNNKTEKFAFSFTFLL